MTPEELEKLPKPLERTMTALELSVMSEIIQRINEVSQITPVIDWLLIRMDAVGKSRKGSSACFRGDESAGLDIDQIYDQAAQSDYIRNKAFMRPQAGTICLMKKTNGSSKLWKRSGNRPGTA